MNFKKPLELHCLTKPCNSKLAIFIITLSNTQATGQTKESHNDKFARIL
jgi:hypothetical protein